MAHGRYVVSSHCRRSLRAKVQALGVEPSAKSFLHADEAVRRLSFQALVGRTCTCVPLVRVPTGTLTASLERG